MRMNLGIFLGLLAVVIALTHYKKTVKPEPAPPYFFSSVTAMDYEPTDTFVRKVILNGQGIGSAGNGGSTVLGALGMPIKWQPGLSVVVEWERCQRYGKNCQHKKKTAYVHPFSQSGETNIHLLDGDDVLIIPSMLGPRHPDYPGPPPPEKNFYKKRGITR